jgi:peptidoglycan/xylan/chitin deacetylase (PgdA/CDA1 family)
MRLAAVSVDLDDIDCYRAIHGLAPPVDSVTDPVYGAAVVRFEELLAELDIKATFFVIGRCLETHEAAAAVRRLHIRGFEIANHSESHRYDLSKLGSEAMMQEVQAASARIATLTGVRPVGFRAPGYTVSDRLFDVLADSGMTYDSSVFPCPAYYSAKSAALFSMKLRGRRSASSLDDPRVLSAPAEPYRVGRPYWKRGSGLPELPIGVTRAVSGRLPFIGTTIGLLGPRGSALLSRLMVGRPLVNLELHGIDLVDPAADAVSFLQRYQPELRRTLAIRRDAIERAVTVLRDAGYEFVRLRDVANAMTAGQA